MSENYRVVKLLKNHIYPTYQLHAFMACGSTDPKDGLRLAALTTMQWLTRRLGDDTPEAWTALPAPEDYLSATDDDLPSLYINQGHVINIVSLPDKGMWTMQITEPDLGSDPGNPKQARTAVPGRIIETNVAYRITGRQLECGFQILISDPVGTEPEAEVYRPTVVRKLMENPSFGLKLVEDIPMKAVRLTASRQIKTMLYVTHHAENILPAVIFTQPLEERRPLPPAADMGNYWPAGRLPLPELDLDPSGLKITKPKKQETKPQAVPVEPPYDVGTFCYYTFSHCRTYVLEEAARREFSTQTGVAFTPGDIVVLYPTALGGGEEVVPLEKTGKKRKESEELMEHGVKSYLKARPIDFGTIVFLSGAREHLLRLSDELLESAETADAAFRQEAEQITAFWKAELEEKDRKYEELRLQLQRQKEYTARLETEKGELRVQCEAEKAGLLANLAKQRGTIAFLQRKNDQPAGYEGIAAWAEKHFSDRLYLHPRAVSRMLTKSCQCADVPLICDALDYLATDYWEERYEQLPRDMALTRCGEKYGRPFDISPIGQMTIDYTPSEYRIKYFKNAQGKETDSDLNYHLRVGNDSENLLRIYFLHDDERRLIVIGSLPDHLRSVTIR